MEGELIWTGSGYPVRVASSGIQIGSRIQTPVAQERGQCGLAEFQGSEQEGSRRTFESREQS